MTSQISHSVVKALSKLVNETPYFVTMIELDFVQKFMILGKSTIFFVDDSLRLTNNAEDGLSKIRYQEIKKIKVFKSHRNFFKMELNSRSMDTLLIISQDAPNLINSLKCYWQIENMERTLSYRELRIDIQQKMSAEEEDNNNNLGLSTSKSNNVQQMQPDPGYVYHMQKNYKFALKIEFERNQKKSSEFVDTSSAHTGLQNSTDVQVFQMIPVDYLDKMTDEKADLKTYCQNEALELIDANNNQQLLMSSVPYMKKYNLTRDKAQWSAWQVHFRVEDKDKEDGKHGDDDDSVYKNEKDLFVTAVRRKYIPPLMECYQDMLVCSVFNYEKSATQVEKARASKRFLQEVHQKVVDTLHPYSLVNLSEYFVFVLQKANALLMDEKSMGFFDEQLNIRPELAFYAISYVKTILQIYKGSSAIIAKMRREIKSMLHILTVKMQFESRQNGGKANAAQQKYLQENIQEPDLVRGLMERWQIGGDSTSMLQAFMSKADANIGKAINKKQKKRQKKDAIWKKKVARYLAYCIDGGLLQSKFTMMTMVEHYDKLEEKQQAMIDTEMAYLLHAHKRDTPWEILEHLHDSAKDIDPQNYSFNQNVMVALIESGYLKNLMKSQRAYPKFLTAMLKDEVGDEGSGGAAQNQNGAAAQNNVLSEVKEMKYDLNSRTLVKEACCRQIIQLFESGDGGGDKGGKGKDGDNAKQNRATSVNRNNEDDKVEYVKLVEPLMQTMKSDNQELAALATSALVNLCSYSPDIKQIFLTKDGLSVILEYLNSKKEIILINVLRLIQVFIAKSEQFTKKIAEERDQESVRLLLKILHGPGIGGVEFSTPVYYYVIIILRQMIRFYAQAKETIINSSSSLQMIINMLKPDNLANIPPEFEVKIYQFLIQLVKEDMDKKTIVGKYIFEDVFRVRLQGIVDPEGGNLSVPLFDSSEQSFEIEYNFFKLMHFLTKQNLKNSNFVKDLKSTLEQYGSQHTAGRNEITEKIQKIINASEMF